MKIGDHITVKAVPKGLEGETKTLFELCVGRTFPIVGIVALPEMGGELFELHVGEVLGQPDYIHSIWIEKELTTNH